REGVRDLGLADEPQGRDVVAGASGADRLEPRALPHRDRLGDEDVLRRAAGDVAGELAERPLGLADARQDFALDDDLRSGRNVEVGRETRRDLERLAEETPNDLELADVRGRVGERAQIGRASWRDRGTKSDVK